MNLPTKLSDVIMQNKDEILALIDHYIENNMNLLFIGSNNTFKSRIITLLVEEFYSKKKINVYKHLVMNIDCFMDITFSNSINEIKTFCKTNTIQPKIVVIDNFDIINESNQQYLKKWMDNCKNTFFIFGCENTNKINEIIQTRITPIYIVDLNTDMTGRYDDEHKGKPDYIYEIGSDKLSSQLREVLVEQNKKHVGLELDFRFNDPNDPNRFYYRSDHYNFAKFGIPVAFFFNGVHDDYHMPGDEVDKIEFDQIQKVGRLVFYMAWEIANREQRLVVDSNKP